MKSFTIIFAGLLFLTGAAHAQVKRQFLEVQRPVQFKKPQFKIASVEAGQFIRLDEAWKLGVTGKGLTVAVCDTGIRATHKDFDGRVAATVNFVSTDPNDHGDRHGHGTNVAGIICASAGIRPQGNTGIAPGAKVAALKVLNDAGGGSFEAFEAALKWVEQNHAAHSISVVNMSVQDGNNSLIAANDSLRESIARLRSIGIPVVVSAGNNYGRWKSEGMAYPAILPETVSVGAVYDANFGEQAYSDGSIAKTTAAGRICSFSQRLHVLSDSKNRTDIFAPGSFFLSSGIEHDEDSSLQQGTSQAAPIVAGVILLMQEYHKRATGKLPSVDDLEKWMEAGAVKIVDGDDEDDNVPHSNRTYQRIDAVAAINAIGAELKAQMFLQAAAPQNLEVAPAAKASFIMKARENALRVRANE